MDVRVIFNSDSLFVKDFSTNHKEIPGNKRFVEASNSWKLLSDSEKLVKCVNNF